MIRSRSNIKKIGRYLATLSILFGTVLPGYGMEEEGGGKRNTLDHSPQDIFDNITSRISNIDFSRLSHVSKKTYKLCLHAQKIEGQKSMYRVPQTFDLLEENAKNHYQSWVYIPDFTPQRTYWVNNNFIELLALHLNIRAGRGNSQDTLRFETLCHRFKSSLLPKNSVLMKYVDYLSSGEERIYDPVIHSQIEKELEKWKNRHDAPNERTLYYFHKHFMTHWHCSPHVLEGASNLFFKLPQRGFPGFVGLICFHQRIQNKSMEKWTMDDVGYLLNDPGLTHRNLREILDVIVSDFNVNTGKTIEDRYMILIEQYLPQLAKIVTKYQLHDVLFKGEFLKMFQKVAPEDLFISVLHHALKNSMDDINSEFTHQDAKKRFLALGMIDKAAIHQKRMAERRDRNRLVTAPRYEKKVGLL